MRIHSVTIPKEVYYNAFGLDVVLCLSFLFGDAEWSTSVDVRDWSTTFTRVPDDE